MLILVCFRFLLLLDVFCPPPSPLVDCKPGWATPPPYTVPGQYGRPPASAVVTDWQEP